MEVSRNEKFRWMGRSTDKDHVEETIQVCKHQEEEMKGTGEWNRMAVRTTVQMDMCVTF